MRATINIDDDVFEAVRAQADATGIELGKAFSDVARAGLQATRNGDRLPVFNVPRNADVIPGDRAAKLLSDAWLVEVARQNSGCLVTMDQRMSKHGASKSLIDVIAV